MPTSTGNYNILIDANGNQPGAYARFEHAGSAPNKLLEIGLNGKTEVFGDIERAATHVFRGGTAGNAAEIRKGSAVRAAITADGTLDLTGSGLQMTITSPNDLAAMTPVVGTVVIIAPMYLAPRLAVWNGTEWLQWS